MVRPALLLLPLPLVLLAAACSKAPPARSPLREQLAAADTPTIEQAARTCLADEAWKVDPVGSSSNGANVVIASKDGEETDVYVYPSDQFPRVTGGPDGDAFWICLGRLLPGVARKADTDKADEADRPPAGDAAPAAVPSGS